MTVAQGVFYLIAAGAVGGALGVVLVKNTFYAALFLILALLSVAAVYILLATEFLALVQILLYGGAVTVLLMFVLMLTRVRDLPETAVGAQWPLAAVAAAVLLGVLITMVQQTAWPRDLGEVTVVAFDDLGDALFRRWAVPFEVASLVLLVALVGAIILARGEEEE